MYIIPYNFLLMNASLRIALAQQNFVVGDLRANAARMARVAREARGRGARLVVFPELSLTGYSPEDLLLRDDFVAAAAAALERLARETADMDVIVGAPVRERGALFNAALHLARGRIAHRCYKRSLPNYEVFDEKRYFSGGPDAACVFAVGGVSLGLTVCEDIWHPPAAAAAARAAADCLINVSASPFDVAKQRRRDNVLRARVRETGLGLLYVNQVGGQDDLVFDGDSRAYDGSGACVLRAPSFEEGVYYCDVSRAAVVCGEAPRTHAPLETVRRALVTGLRDYVVDNGFRGVVVALSGGIDSALTLVLAVDALGCARVKAVTMPSPYTSRQSLEDARLLARTEGVELFEIPITRTFETMLGELAPVFGDRVRDVAEENLQARIRGALLMALSNKLRLMPVATSNKSELAVGYATLYGDMAGGYAPLKDVFKKRVYALAAHVNRAHERIPPRVIERAPSAELAPGQLDTDSLPPYPVLDEILEQLIENDAGAADLARRGFDAAMLRRVRDMVVKSEYKRRQAPPGPKITPRAFGRERRYPITSLYEAPASGTAPAGQ